MINVKCPYCNGTRDIPELARKYQCQYCMRIIEREVVVEYDDVGILDEENIEEEEVEEVEEEKPYISTEDIK